jgi:hypothetical protein
MIEISAEYGEPKASKRLWPIHHTLNRLFEEHLRGNYFAKGLCKLGIVLRVSGRVQEFAGEGPERVRYFPPECLITLDLVIPEVRWKAAELPELNDYLEEQVRKSFALLVDFAVSRSLIADQRALQNDFEKAMAAYSAGRE